MYSFKNEEILKEVDSFIAQAKLEGDISGSSSSNVSLNVNASKNKTKEATKFETIKETEDQHIISSNKDRVVSNPVTADCFIECETSNILTKTDLDNNTTNINLIKEPPIDTDISKSVELVREKSKSPVVEKEIKCKRSYGGHDEEESCDSSFVDIGSDSNRSKIPYVMWLQQRRSRQNLHDSGAQDSRNKKKLPLREEVHLHQVNSALFWERWIDQLFEMYDQWVGSSDSDDDRNIPKRMYSDPGNINRPTKTRSEPVMRVQSDDSMTSHLKFKCPSYVDWLVHRRQERTELSDSEQVVENKINNNYWSSLYGKLTKSLSSIFPATRSSSSRGEAQVKQENIETMSLIDKSNTKQSCDSAKQTKLRRSQSHPCSHLQPAINQSKLRFRQLSQESVGSPVLTDQLVELVCNTLSPGSSSSEEDTRKPKPYRRIAKRKY